MSTPVNLLALLAGGDLLCFVGLPASAFAHGRGREYSSSNHSRQFERCDQDGDECAVFRCDRDGDRCIQVSPWYDRGNNRYYAPDRDRADRFIERCDRDGDECATFRCDWDGDDCERISNWRDRDDDDFEDGDKY